MTTDDRKPNENFSIDSEQQVSAWYKTMPADSTPDWLDDVVLRQASTAAKANRSSAIPGTWWRPATVIASLGLSLMIVLQFGDAWFPGDTTPDSLTTNAQNAAGEMADVVKGSAGRVRAQTNNAANRLNLGAPNLYTPTSIRSCETAQAKSADDWWACILQLEQDGRTAEAAAERDRIETVFPESRPSQ